MAGPPKASTRMPPASGPAARPMPLNPAHNPIALTRSRGWGCAATSNASEAGLSAAAPTPCSTRPVISQPIEGASEHTTDATVNTATPVRNTRLRPNRSAKTPPASSSMATSST